MRRDTQYECAFIKYVSEYTPLHCFANWTKVGLASFSFRQFRPPHCRFLHRQPVPHLSHPPSQPESRRQPLPGKRLCQSPKLPISFLMYTLPVTQKSLAVQALLTVSVSLIIMFLIFTLLTPLPPPRILTILACLTMFIASLIPPPSQRTSVSWFR